MQQIMNEFKKSILLGYNVIFFIILTTRTCSHVQGYSNITQKSSYPKTFEEILDSKKKLNKTEKWRDYLVSTISSSSISSSLSKPNPNKIKSSNILKESFPSIERIRNNFHSATIHDLDSILIGPKRPHFYRHSNDSEEAAKEEFQNHTEHKQRNTQSSNSQYISLRIRFMTDEIENFLATAADDDDISTDADTVSTARKKKRIQYLLDHVLPQVGDFYNRLLQTKAFLFESIEVTRDVCFREVEIIPDDIIENGITDADMAIFVKAQMCGMESSIAAASPCGLSTIDYRPAIGIIYFCLENNVLDEEESSSNGSAVEVAIHEIAHVLGMNSDLFPFFLNPETGYPFVSAANLDTETLTVCADGVPRRVLQPSSSVLKSGISSTGARHFEIVTPTVKTVVRNQFDCQILTGARLENQPTAARDCFGSHWDERLFFTEAMGAYYGSEVNAFSALTLALLEDTGWFIGDYSMTQKSPFGHGAGCAFVNSNCIVNGGDIPEYSKGFFCNSVSSLDGTLNPQCTSTHYDIGYCDLFDFHADEIDLEFLPPQKFQYFSQRSISPLFFDRADYCPIPIPIEGGSCRMDDSGNTINNAICVNIQSSLSSYTVDCVIYRCNKNKNILQISFYDKPNKRLNCDFDFQMLTHPDIPNTQIECPRLAVVCPDLMCPSNCSGKGVCDYSKEKPKCNCFDPNDKTPSCSLGFTSNENINRPTQKPTLSPTKKPTKSPSKRPQLLPSASPVMIFIDPSLTAAPPSDIFLGKHSHPSLSDFNKFTPITSASTPLQSSFSSPHIAIFLLVAFAFLIP